MRLVLAARSGDLLQEVAQSCNTQAIIFAADLRDKNAPQKLVALAMEKLGRIDLLVNNGLGMCLLESVPDHHSEALWGRGTLQKSKGEKPQNPPAPYSL